MMRGEMTRRTFVGTVAASSTTALLVGCVSEDSEFDSTGSAIITPGNDAGQTEGPIDIILVDAQRTETGNIKVFGTAVNNSERPLYSASVTLRLYDEQGRRFFERSDRTLDLGAGDKWRY